MTLLTHIQNHLPELQALAKEKGVSNIRLVGSVARGEDTEESDIDFYVDFDPNIAGGIAIGGFQYYASELLGRHVDVIATNDKLYPEIRASFERDALPLSEL